jgi:hypothetical protein
LVCINDLSLVAEYSLGELPALVYYRHTIPILYQGKVTMRIQHAVLIESLPSSICLTTIAVFAEDLLFNAH